MTESEFLFGEDRREQAITRKRKIEPNYPTRTTDPLRPVKRLFAGVLAIFAGVFSGMASGKSTFVEPVQTSSGEAMLFNQPDAAFWYGVGWLFVGVLLMMYATWDSGGVRP